MKDASALRWTIGVLWTFLAAAATVYAWRKGIPNEVAIPAALAFLVEAALYVAAGFESCRNWLASRPGRYQPALLLWMTSLLPYLIYCAAPGRFTLKGFALLALITGVTSFWYRLAPHRPLADVGFLVLMAAPLLAGVFRDIYPAAAPRSPVDILGHLAWIRIGVVAILAFRKLAGTGFGFIPSKADWLAGLTNYLYFLPLLFGLALGLDFARLRAVDWWTVLPVLVGTFLGFLWVVALSEELFFRGLLLPLFMKLFSHRWAGLIATSIAFGLVHLSFRSFPNWKFALLAAIAGVFYGRAFLQTQSVRAAMVAHALTATTWRVFMN